MISVCMGVYNGAAFLEEQLQSILNQTMPADQVILCDDCSTDDTAAVIEGFIKNNRLEETWKLYRNRTNKGYPANYYYAMSLCQGDYVFLADQDDIWDVQKIEHMMGALKNTPDIKVLSCKFGLIDATGKKIHTFMKPAKSKDSKQTKKIGIKDVFYKCEWPGMVLAYHRQWYESNMQQWKEQWFQDPEEPKVPHDFLLCAWGAEAQGFWQLDESLAWHRRHENNTGKEEHRLGRLISRERKLQEIEAYLHILSSFKEQKILLTPRGNQALLQKEIVMKERYNALYQAKGWMILKSAWRNRKDIRIVSVACDLMAAFRYHEK